MQCRRCQAVLTQVNRSGDRILRTRGIVWKPYGLRLICPSCKGEVPFSIELLTSPAVLAVGSRPVVTPR